jgi:CRISPR-associated endoribonuclease Cas6
MRIVIKFSPIGNSPPISYFENKFTIQGMFYNFFFRSDKLKNKHDEKGFKFFCFSDVFIKDGYYYIIFSSPIKDLVNELYSVLKKIEHFYIGYQLFKKESIKRINFRVGKRVRWETGSPILVYYKNRPYSFYKERDFNAFFERLRENSIKKYKAFYGEDIEIGDIFTKVEFKKSVAIPLEKSGKKFLVFGSTWRLLEKEYVDKKERKFYKFLLDVGVGEKNSLGFGFVNPIKEDLRANIQNS